MKLVDFFARAKPGDVRATLAAFLELDEVRAVAILRDIGHPNGAELISAVYVGASPARLPGAAHRHPLSDLTRPIDSAGMTAGRCPACAASLDRRVPSLYCRLCRRRLSADRRVTSDAILPFQVNHERARATFEDWVSSRPFAPASLRTAEAVYAEAVYLPFWSFSATRITDYIGQRGTAYKATESGGREYGEGSDTEWGPQRPGTFIREFSDVLVPACLASHGTLPPWPVGEAVTYHERFLSGVRAVQHDVEPASAFAIARQQMAKTVMSDCRTDIGGDRQKVEHESTSYRQAAYALVLLPVWFISYRHNGREWRCVINGYTGKIKGERPLSATKIWLTVLVAAAIIASMIAVPIYFLH